MIGADGSLAEDMAVYDTTDCPGDGYWDGTYSWSTFPKLSLGDLEVFDFYVIGDYLYVIGGQDATGIINTNRKMPMSNFPVNTYTTTVSYGQAGPKVYINTLEIDFETGGNIALVWSDFFNQFANFRQDINVQNDINVKLYIDKRAM